MTHTVLLNGQASRQRAAMLIAKAPSGYICKISEPKRSLDQNAKLWAMLTDISTAKPLGRMLTPDEWKAVFMQACGWEQQFLEGLDGRPFPTGFRSSRMTVAQMADLITFVQAYGDQQGVRWTDCP